MIELRQGDITKQEDIEAIVNAANAELMPGGGVAGAIHRVAGPELKEVCRPLAPIKPGEAVATDAFKLPNKKIIHTLGPVYGKDKPENKLLAKCYANSIDLARAENLSSIGFPAISSGAFGFPLEEAASVALELVNTKLKEEKNLLTVVFVLFSDKDLDVFLQQAENMGISIKKN